MKERPSIYVVRPVRKGQRFTGENIRVIRPANGLAPKHYGLVIGRQATRDIDAGVPLSWDLVEAGARHER